MPDPNVQQGSPEPSKKDILNGLFDKALKAMKDAVGARQQIDPAKELVALDDKAKESFEAPKGLFEKKFDLGEYEIKPEDLKAQNVKIEDKHAYLLVGSVDQVAFDKANKREIKWYQALQQDAELFLQVKDRVETDFPGLKDTAKSAKMMNIIDKMSKMTDFTDAAWAKIIADNKYTDEEIYGAEGAYNLLLAFQRAIGSVDRKVLLNPPEIILEAIPPFEPVSVKQFARIRLELSGKKGKSDEDRFSRLIGVEVKELQTDPDYTYGLSDDQKILTVSRTVKGKKESKDYPIDNKDGLQIRIHRLDVDHSNKLVAVFQGNEVVKFEFDPKNGKFKVFGASPNNQYDVELNAAGTIVIKKKEAQAAAPAQPPAPTPPQAPAQPQAPAESPEAAKIKAMAQELQTNKFILFEEPTDFHVGYYAKYGEKRLSIWLNEDGTCDYSILSIAEGNTMNYKGNSMSPKQMADEIVKMPEGHNDYVKALMIDLGKVPGYPNVTLATLEKDPQGDAYEPNTYKVSIPDYMFKNSKGVDVKVNIEFVAAISAKKGYETEGLAFITPDNAVHPTTGRISDTEDVTELFNDITEKVKESVEKAQGD